MLAVSNAVRKKLHRSLTSQDRPELEGKCFRIVPTEHELFLTLKVAEPAPDDQTFRYDGIPVLALPSYLQRVCSERRLKVNDAGRIVLH
jgi:hypothetical protein